MLDEAALLELIDLVTAEHQMDPSGEKSQILLQSC